MKTLHILQSKSHAIYYMKNFKNSKIDIPFALNIDCMYLLDRYNLYFLTIKDIYKNSKQIQDRNLFDKKFHKFMEDFDKLLNLKYDDAKYIAESFGYQFSVVLKATLFSNFLAKHLGELDFKKIICYEDYTILKSIYKYRKNHNLLIYLSLLSNQNNFILKKKLFIPSLALINDQIKMFLKYNFYGIIRIFLKPIKNRKNIKNEKRILMLGGEYDWKKYLQYSKFMISRLPKKINLLCFLENHKNKTLYDQIMNKISIEFDVDINFIKNSVKPLIKKSLKNIVFIRKNKNYFENIVKKYSAVITCCIIDPLEAYLAYKFKQAGKPIFLWQHGERGQISEDNSKCFLFEYSELRLCTHYLSYSCDVANYVEEYIQNNNLKIIKPKFYAVGSLDKKISINKSNNKNLVILASGKVKGLGGNEFEGDPDFRLYNIHKTFLEIANQHSNDFKFLLKVNNTPMFNNLQYKSKNVLLETKTPFKDLLSLAKVVILDTPATTLLEASQINIPIFAVLGRSPYNKKFIELSNRRICWCKDHKELKIKLTNFLENNIYEADLFDKKFEYAYLGNISYEDSLEKVENIIDDNI